MTVVLIVGLTANIALAIFMFAYPAESGPPRVPPSPFRGPGQ